MKKQQIFTRISILAIVLLFSGCGIFSLHPLYHDENLLVKSELIGTWQNSDDANTFISIDTLGDKMYEFVLVDKEDTVNFEMGLLQLGDQFFIDLFPSEDDCGWPGGGDCDQLELMFRNYIPVHTFMKFEYKDNNLFLTEFDNERLIDLFDQKRIRLSHEMAGKDNDYVVITASTNDLQKFISRYANDKEAFVESEKYHRL